MAGTSFVASWSASMYKPSGSIEPSLDPGGSYAERKGRDSMAASGPQNFRAGCYDKGRFSDPISDFPDMKTHLRQLESRHFIPGIRQGSSLPHRLCAGNHSHPRARFMSKPYHKDLTDPVKEMDKRKGFEPHQDDDPVKLSPEEVVKLGDSKKKG